MNDLIKEYRYVLEPVYKLFFLMFIPNFIPMVLAFKSLWWLVVLTFTLPFTAASLYIGINHNWFGGFLND